MNKSKYLKFKNEDLILRDHLALERTAMANERTLLAYGRTMIGTIAVGVTFIKLFSGILLTISGWLLISMGSGLMILGFIRYAKIELILSKISSEDTLRDDGDWMHKIMWDIVLFFRL